MTQVQILIDSGSEVNAIYPTFAKQLGFTVSPTKTGVQKIDGIKLDIYGIVVVALLVVDKVNQVRFFEEIFWVSNISPEVVFGIFFLPLSSMDMNFLGRELW